MPTYEYDILLSLEELQAAGKQGWRLHTAMTEVENQQTIYIVERVIVPPTDEQPILQPADNMQSITLDVFQ